MTKAELHRFFASQELAVLGTLSERGTPECALVGFAVTPKLEIIFDTVSSSRKHGNLLRNPHAAFVIGWANEITAQYEGVARIPTGEELERYREIYFAKWPDCRERLVWPGITHFVVAPNWIRYSDYNPGSHTIVEFNLSDCSPSTAINRQD